MDFLKLIKLIDEQRLVFFTSLELANIIGVDTKSIQNYLETLANNELIIRVEKGKYCRPFLRDKYVIGSNLVHGGVVSYVSALQYYGLTSNDDSNVFISSDHQKTNKTLLNFSFNFIKIRPHKYFGIVEENNNNGKFRITDPEKTILDCFDLPQYTNSFKELVQIFSTQKLEQSKLIDYGKRMNNLSVLKRMAFLSEKLELRGYSKFRKTTVNLVNNKYSLLNPSGPDVGPFNSKWKIRDNMAFTLQ